MDTDSFNLAHFNETLNKGIKGQDLTFCNMITYVLKGKLSIVAQYEKTPKENDLFTLDSSCHVVPMEDYGNFYYGLSPLIDSELILENISKLNFSSLTGLDRFISQHCHMFMCHSAQKQYLPDFARYAMLALASNYGVCIHRTQELDSLCRSMDPSQQILNLADRKLLRIRGCPTEDMLNRLNVFRYKKASDGLWEISPKGNQSIRQIYGDPENIRLVNGHVFYSGVLLKPIRLTENKNRYESFAVDSLKILFERSTYATVFVLDGYYLEHPLLEDPCLSNMRKMFAADNACKSELISSISRPEADSLQYARVAIHSVNRYLSSCINVNQIGVSANIITDDRFLLLGKRNSKTIDSGNLYPGVNGNTEVADSNVSFYQNSVYEDYPTIRLDSDRIDFSGEINREAYAELRIDAPKQEWICCGIMISGTIPEKEHRKETDYVQYRRMHFNIIFQQQNTNTFDEISVRSKKATEAFENDQIMGIQMKIYKNPWDFLGKKLLAAGRFLLDSKDIIESILLLVLTFGTTNITQLGGSDILSAFFAFLVILITGYTVITYIRQWRFHQKTIRHLSVFQWQSHEKMEEKLQKLMKNYKFHPAAYACIALYADSCACDELK